MSEEFDASKLVEDLAETLAEPEVTGPKYLVTHTGLNHAQRRAIKKLKARSAKHLETWKRQLNRAGINWEDVLVERAKRAEKRKAA